MLMQADHPVKDRALTPAQLKDLSVRADGPGLVRAISHYSVIGVLGIAIWAVAASDGLLWATPLIVAQGFFVAFLFMAVHEAAHKTVFKNRRMNEVLGHLSSLAIIYPYEYYALFHWDHHRFTQDPDRDPELLAGTFPTSDTRLLIAYSGVLQLMKRLRLLFRHAITGTVVAPWIPDNKRALVVREARAYAGVYGLLLAGSVWLSTTILFWTWLLPLVIGQMFLRPYLYAEHTGCDRTRSAFENTRTTYTGAVMKWLTWNMPFHVEHHAYPSVPFHALPKLNDAIAGRIQHAGKGYLAVTRETLQWFRRARRVGETG